MIIEACRKPLLQHSETGTKFNKLWHLHVDNIAVIQNYIFCFSSTSCFSVTSQRANKYLHTVCHSFNLL